MRDEDRDAPGILGRLRSQAEHQLDEPVAPRWAAPVGWVITLAIVATVLYAVVKANPL